MQLYLPGSWFVFDEERRAGGEARCSVYIASPEWQEGQARADLTIHYRLAALTTTVNCMTECHMLFRQMTHVFKPQTLLLLVSFPVVLSLSVLVTTEEADARCLARCIIDAPAATAIFFPLTLLHSIRRQHVLVSLLDLF